MKGAILLIVFASLLIVSVSTLPIPNSESGTILGVVAIAATTIAAPIISFALKIWLWQSLIDKGFDRLGQWELERFAIEKQKFREGMWDPSKKVNEKVERGK